MSRPHRRARVSLLVAVATAAALAPSAAAAGPADIPLEELRVTTTQVAGGLQRPTAIAGLPDGRLLITQKRGSVRVFHPATGLNPTPILDISARVSGVSNERGLLGIAPAPDFAASGIVYVAYTRQPDNALTLSRIPLTDAGAEQVLLTQDHAQFGNHNGGQLAFGPDGMLYWSLGDGGSAGDPFASGQNLGTLLGKILRVDVGRACAPLPYCVPDDNPFVGRPGARGEIWAYGLRNAWRFSFDAEGGDLWIADVGQGTHEEVNHQPAGQGGGNYGWSCMEGPDVFNAARCEPGAVHIGPVFHYQTSVDGCAVIGGHVYRGQQFAALAAGTYVATDYCSSTAWAVRENPDGTFTNARIGTFPIQPTSLGADVNGELYVVNDLPGQLHRVGFQQVPPAS